MLLTMGLLLTEDHGTIGVYMSFVGKIFNIGAWATQLTYVAELLPSEVRSTGIAACMLIGNCGAMIAPLILTIDIDWLPLTVFGTISIMSATIHLFLPELTGIPMFMTIDDQRRYYSKVTTTTKYLLEVVH